MQDDVAYFGNVGRPSFIPALFSPLLFYIRFWYLCSAGILFLFLLYLLNGGTIVIVLLIFALAGWSYEFAC